MNEIETGMKYCREAEYGVCKKKLERQLLPGINQTEGGQENMPYTFRREPNKANVQIKKQEFRELNSRYERYQNAHEILPKSRLRKMSKRPGLKRAREMNEIKTGMRYCRKAE